MALFFFEVFSTKHLFYSIAGRSKTRSLNAFSSDWNL
ncbi:unnamed protein product [Acanthoscelides obtectus]|uniref:Uncharacterized protein n=1 Tax=Acanthoscelides obtectus TaxID=200917 RepID=A0A9P0MA40_ACAOB|nr:unnamed protein product [Acanthoscelides obtectus]CAK1645021.1 hypothetical protein AOBTE_LOCUS13991 [Acanthoscelides obtectus]